MGSAHKAFAQPDLDYEATGELLVPRSWVTRWYARAEYLALWTTGNPLPPLLTTSPAGTLRSDAGVLGEPGTEVLLGQAYAEDDGHQGGRLTFGYWFDDVHTRGVEAQLWAAGIARDSLVAGSLGDPILARPFFNTENNLEDAELIAFPAVTVGDILADARSEVYSVDVLARYNWLKGPGAYLDFCWGYRFFRFWESLSIREALVSAIGVADQFVTENDFHGADLGAVVGLQRGGWLLDLTAKVALGDMRERLSIDGATTLFTNPPWSVPGGWLAAPSNVGVYTHHEFAAIPELGVRLAFVAFEIIELSVGYNVIYVSSVLRTGEQIDRTVNPGQLAILPLARGGGVPSGALRPQARLDEASLWMHGISFGAELRW